METSAATVAPFPAGRVRPRAGLVLTGGGARAAYQVGVVKAVRDILGNPERNPFPILCGTSAGAVNAATLAVFADDFNRAVGNLLEVWEHMHCHHIYRTDAWSIMKSWSVPRMRKTTIGSVSAASTPACPDWKSGRASFHDIGHISGQRIAIPFEANCRHTPPARRCDSRPDG